MHIPILLEFINKYYSDYSFSIIYIIRQIKSGKKMILLVILFVLSVSTTVPPPYCFMDNGCAIASHCQCVWFFTYCNIDDESSGTCRFTTPGIVTLSSILIILVILVIFFVCCLCCCCRPRCCKSKKDNPTNIHYHNAPFDLYSKL